MQGLAKFRVGLSDVGNHTLWNGSRDGGRAEQGCRSASDRFFHIALSRVATSLDDRKQTSGSTLPTVRRGFRHCEIGTTNKAGFWKQTP